MAILAVLALTGVTRLAVAWRAENVAQDAGVLLNFARELPSRPVEAMRAFRQHPGYPALVLAAARLTGADWPDGWIRVGQVISAVTAVLAVAAVYFLALALPWRNRVAGVPPAPPAGVPPVIRGAALVAALMLVFSPRYVQISSDALSDSLALALGLWCLVLGLWARRQDGTFRAAALAALAGLAGGAAYLTRPEYLLAPVLSAGVLLWPRAGRRPALLPAVACLAVAAACAAPYMVAIGGLSLKKTPEDFSAVNPQLSGVAWPARRLPAPSLGGWPCWPPLRAASAGIGMATANGAEAMPPAGGLASLPVATAWPAATARVVGKIGEALGPAGAVLAVCAAVALALPPLRRRAMALSPLPAPLGWALMLAPALALAPLLATLEAAAGRPYVSTRHLLLPAATLMPLAGLGLVLLAEAAAVGLARIGRAGLTGLVVVVLLLTIPAGAFSALATPLHADKATARVAGLFIRKLGGGGRFVAASETRSVFFADAPPEQFAEGTDMPPGITGGDVSSAYALLARLRRDGPRQYRYLVLDHRRLADARAAGTLDALPAGLLEPLAHFGKDPFGVQVYSLNWRKQP